MSALLYFNDVHGAQDIGVEGVLHVSRAGFLQGAFSQHACVVNQQVETPCPDLVAHLLGTLFDATQVSGVYSREKDSQIRA